MSKGMEYCVDNNPYNDDEEEEEEEWELKEMAECKNYEFENNNNNRKLAGRKLDREDKDEAEYLVGAYCSENGGNIYPSSPTSTAATRLSRPSPTASPSPTRTPP